MRHAYLPLCFVFLLIFCPASDSYGQSMYFPEGASGFAFGGGYVVRDRSDAVVLQGGYSYIGIYDLGVMISKPAVQPHVVDVMSITPFFSVHVFKENDRTPVSFLFSMSYQYNVYMGEVMTWRAKALHGSAVTVGGRLYKTVPNYDRHYLQPYIGIAQIFRSEDVPYGSADNRDTVIEIGLDAVVRLTSRIRVVPGVNVIFDDEDYAVGISANLIDRSR